MQSPLTWPGRLFRSFQRQSIIERLGITAIAIIFSFCAFMFIGQSTEELPSFEALAAEDMSFAEWHQMLELPNWKSWDKDSLKLILQNMSNQAQTYDDWEIIRQASDDNYRYNHFENLALQKMSEISTTFDQALYTYKKSSGRSTSQVTFSRLPEVARTFADWKYIWEHANPNHPLKEQARLRMQELAG